MRWVVCAIGGCIATAWGGPAAESLPLGQPVPRAGGEAPAGGAGSVLSPGDLAETLVTLGAVVGGILALAWVVRVVARRGGGLAAAMGPGGRAPSGVMEVLGRYPVSRGQTLVLLKLDRRVLLLSQRAGEGLRTLCEITEPEEVASLLVKTQGEGQRAEAERFGGMLRKYAEPKPTIVPPHAAPAPAPAARRLVSRSDAGDRVELLSGMTGADAAAELRKRLARLKAGTLPVERSQ